MADPSQTHTTQLLRAWAGGDRQALTQLVPRVHHELCRLAGHFLQNERPGMSLQAADLVQEVYLRLVDVEQLDWQHRAHFFAVSATVTSMMFMIPMPEINSVMADTSTSTRERISEMFRAAFSIAVMVSTRRSEE